MISHTSIILLQTDMLFEQVYFGNSLLLWIASILGIVASVLLGRFLYWIFSKTLKSLISKSKNTFDDLVVDLIEKPIVAALIATGMFFSLNILTLPGFAENTISKAFTVAITFIAAWLITRVFEAFYRNVMIPWAQRTENDLDDQLLPILRKGIRAVIWILAFLIGLSNAGYDVGAMLAGLGIGGLALAMAAKDTVSNVFGGFTIFTDKPFRVGDRINISGVDGTVTEIGLRSTRIKTLAGRIVTMPNSSFSDSAVENISSEPDRKITLNLSLTYDTSPEQIVKAMEILKEISAANSSTQETVVTSFNAFGDFALNVLFVYYIIKDEDIAQTQTEINLEILRRFKLSHLEFAFPTQTLHTIPA